MATTYWPAHAALRREGATPGEVWLKGGRGSGKSSFISLEIVLGLLRDRQASALICRKVAATLRESVYEQVIWAVRRLGLEALFRFRLSPLEIERVDTGQRILFRGSDDPGKLKSLKLASGYIRYLWLEELAEFDGMDEVRTIRLSALRGTDAACVTFFSYNPPVSPANWVNAEAMAGAPGRLTHHSSYLDMPEGWLGGAFLAEAEHLRRTNARAYRHTYLGEATGSGGEVFGNLRLRAITDEERARLDGDMCGLDFGFASDPDAIVRVAWEPRARRLWVLAEYCAARTPLDRLAEAAREIAGGAVVRCDSAEPRMIDELRVRGVRAAGARKGPGSVAHGLRWLQDAGEIVIDPAACPNAAREFAGYAYPPDGRGGYLPEYPDRDNHLIDAVRYALEPLIGRRRAKVLKRGEVGI